MTTLHHPTSRPITNKCLWEWPVAGQDYIHDKSTFTRTNCIRSFYVVHPDWISEDFNRPRTNGRVHRPWPWEFPGARSLYTQPDEYFRKRVNNEMEIEENARKVNSADPHYKVAHATPPHVNDQREVQHSSVYEKRPMHHPWVMHSDNHRGILKRELSLPPLTERLNNGDLSKNLERGRNVDFGEQVQLQNIRPNTSAHVHFGSVPPMPSKSFSPRNVKFGSYPYTYSQSISERSPTRQEAESFRRLGNTYMTACSWQ